MLKNSRLFRARKFTLKAEMNDQAIHGNSLLVLAFCWVKHCVSEICNTNTGSYTYTLGWSDLNDIARSRDTFLTGSRVFRVKEIEVFKITD
jgi:hypothetical protein